MLSCEQWLWSLWDVRIPWGALKSSDAQTHLRPAEMESWEGSEPRHTSKLTGTLRATVMAWQGIPAHSCRLAPKLSIPARCPGTPFPESVFSLEDSDPSFQT